MKSINTTIRWASALVSMLALGACGVQQNAEQKGFAASSNAKNIAIILTGSHEGHIPKNAARIREVMSDPGTGYNFQILEKQRATDKEAIEITRQAAAQVGDDGTLLWYFSSHGATNGTLQTYGSMLSFDKVAAAIKQARGGRPLKRLVVIVQACYSGQIVNGSLAVGRTDYPVGASALSLTGSTFKVDQTTAGAEQDLRDDQNLASYTNQLMGINGGATRAEATTSAYATPATGKLAEQLLVMSAAARNEPSMYSSDGSHFTTALYNTFKQLRANPNVTMHQFLTAVQKKVSSSRPQFRAVPEALVLAEPLYSTMGSAGGTPAINSTQSIASMPSTGIQNIALMVSNVDNQTRVFASAQSGTAKIYVCQGTVAVCSQPTAQRGEIAMYGTTTTGNRVIFASAWTFQANVPYAILAVDAAGRVMHSRSVSFKNR